MTAHCSTLCWHFVTVSLFGSWFWQFENTQTFAYKTINHTSKLTVSAVTDPVHLSPYDRGSFSNCVMLSLSLWVCQTASVRLSLSADVNARMCEKCAGKALAVCISSHCLHEPCVYVDVSVLLCFFSTSISSVGFYSVKKNQWSVDDNVMMWFMSHPFSFLMQSCFYVEDNIIP